LSKPASTLKYEWQQKQPYNEQHYKSSSSSSEEKAKTKEKRYYIYNYATEKTNRDENEINAEKSRKVRSSSASDRKQVSKNISMVLENLLKSYENSQLPTHGEGN
jgi:hypothetical protein